MKNLFLTVVAVLLLAGCDNGTKYKMVDGTIFCQVPERVAGQSDMIAFAAEPIDTVRVGFIGLGMHRYDELSLSRHLFHYPSVLRWYRTSLQVL